MSIEFKKPSEVVKAQGLKAVIYGAAGSGKTRFCVTGIPPTLLVSAESGVMTVRNAPNVEIAEIHSLSELEEIYQHLAAGTKFQTVAVDSLSEIAEVVLQAEFQRSKHKLAAYGEMADLITGVVRKFRDLPKYDVVFTCKQDRVQDDNGRLIYSPSTPGSKLQNDLPHFVDLVGAMRLEKSPDGDITHWVQCRGDGKFLAKNRTGNLDVFEEPNLAQIKQKMFADLVTPTAKAA